MKRIETKYLILGNSTAAVACIEGIRSLDQAGEITVVSSEEEHTYSRPLISYWLAGEIDDKRMEYKSRDFYTQNKVRLYPGCEAIGVDARRRVVFSSDDREFSFEKLLVATGGAPITPTIPGIDAEGVFTFQSWDDARKIREFIQRRKVQRAAILGGGLIGIKAMETLHSLGIEIAILEMGPFLLNTMLDQKASEIIHDQVAGQGVSIHCDTTIRLVKKKKGCVTGAELINGGKLSCDMIILAIGVRPNIAMLDGSSIETDRGVLVDEGMRTNIPGVYAAGDVAQGYDRLLGKKRPIAIFPSAARQGKISGVNMAGGKLAHYGDFAMNSVGVLKLPIISVGDLTPGEDGEILVHSDSERKVYKKIILKQGRVTGAIFVNQVDRAGLFTGLLRSGIDVADVKHLLLDNEFGLLFLPREYRKYVVSGMGIEV